MVTALDGCGRTVNVEFAIKVHIALKILELSK